MKKNVFVLVVFSALLTLCSCGAKADKNGWFSDFEAAKKTAQAKNKNIILMVNSDYDIDGSATGVKALTETDDFTKALSDGYVCVHFDFTNLQAAMEGPGIDATSAEQKAAEKRKETLQKQFLVADMLAIQETPAMVITTRDGYFITNITSDFASSSVDGYVGLINAEKQLVDMTTLKVEATKVGSAKERIAAIDAIYEGSTENQRLALVGLSKKLVDLDKKNESGLVGKHLFSIANAEAFMKINSMDFVGAIKTYSAYAEDKRMKPVDSQALYFMAASTMARSGINDINAIISYLQKSIDADPENENVDNIKTIMQNLEMMHEQQNAAAASETGAAEASGDSVESQDEDLNKSESDSDSE